MNFIKKYWFFIILALVATLLGLLKLLTPPLSEENTWNNITPNKTTETQLEPPLKILEGDKGKILLYQTGEENWATEVYVNKNQKVEGIKRYFPPEGENYQGYVDRLGQPDHVLYGPHSQAGFNVFTFLSKGIAITANPESGLILEIWHFPPTDIEKFFNSWGKELQTTPPNQF